VAGVSTLNPGNLTYYPIMKNSTSNGIPKRRGRPATGKALVMAVRLSNDLRTDIDDWRRRQQDLPTRSEAIRRLGAAALRKR
jgi:hypothetical protein